MAWRGRQYLPQVAAVSERVLRCPSARGWKAGLATIRAAAHAAQGHASVHVVQLRHCLEATGTKQPSTMGMTEWYQLFLYLSRRLDLLHGEAPELSTKFTAGWQRTCQEGAVAAIWQA